MTEMLADVQTDLASDHLLRPVPDVVRSFLGTVPSLPTLWRWRLKGVRGSRLECVRVGQRWMTTGAAFRRFVEGQTLASLPGDDDGDGERDEATAARLAEAGLL